MDPLVTAVIAALVAGGLGFVVGRGSGSAAGQEEGRRKGLAEGRAQGITEGRKSGHEEGERSGREEGRRQGLEEGRRAGHEAGVAEGKRAGAEEGRAAGLEAGRREGRAEGVEQGRREGRTEGREEGMREGRAAGEEEARGKVRGSEREAAMRDAIGRVSVYLNNAVRDPLSGAGPDADRDELAERIERALGALQDLDFFIEEIDEQREGTDLVALAQSVSRDFAADQEIAVRMLLAASRVEADVNAAALMDALYLILHNAGRFGGGSTIDMAVDSRDGTPTIVVRDRGEGFSEEAFSRAFDPFYSTAPDGLGLGLPHARRVIEGMGGRIVLRNVPDGGAEVEVTLPAA